ncbi:LrgB family protein [Burkholderia multivorans]|nr:LrgB family protein [Burkholderia multivorans]
MLRTIWTPLAPTPLLWLTVTLAAFALGQAIHHALRRSPLANPILIAIVLVVLLLRGTSTPYAEYFAGAQFINFLLGPATVALAVPLALNLDHIRRSLNGLGIALLAGSLTSTLSGVAVVWAMGGGHDIAMSMAPKSVTTPIAIAIAQEVGGVPALTAALAIAGGIVAAAIGRTVLRWFHVDDWRSHGFAAGVAGAGVAAAQIAPLNGIAAAFAAIGIGLNGLVTALVVPLLAMAWPLK